MGADKKETNYLRFVRNLSDEHKNEIYMYYAELKLKLPGYVKSLTIKELRDAGAVVDPDIYMTKKIEETLRTQASASIKLSTAFEKLASIREQNKDRIFSYYQNLKRQIPKDILVKTLSKLDEEDRELLGVNLV